MKIKRNVPLDPKEKPRRIWPFKDMKVSDIVEVDNPKEWSRAAKAAHTHGSKKGWRMRTVWDDDKKIGRIRRMA